MAEKSSVGVGGTVRVISIGIAITLILVVIGNVDFNAQDIGASIRSAIRAGGENFRSGMAKDMERSKQITAKAQPPLCADLEAKGARIGTITVWGGPDGGERTAYSREYPSGRTCIVGEGDPR